MPRKVPAVVEDQLSSVWRIGLIDRGRFNRSNDIGVGNARLRCAGIDSPGDRNSSCRTKIVSLWSMHGHRRSHPYGQERISVMVRLRNAVMVVMLATGLAGCASGHWPSIAHFSIWHCDTCDDFPTPAYGPGYSMMPGTYTGPPSVGSNGSGGPAASTSPAAATGAPAAAAPAAPLAPAGTSTTPPSLPTP